MMPEREQRREEKREHPIDEERRNPTDDEEDTDFDDIIEEAERHRKKHRKGGQ